MKTNEQSRRHKTTVRWIVRIFMIVVTVAMIYPLLWNVYSSFKTNNEFLTDAFSLPKGFAWDNYARAIEKSDLLSNVGNSVFIVIITLVVIMLCAVPCAYCLARFKFIGSALLLNVYMAAIFIQATFIMIPLFLQMNLLHLLNNRTAIAILYATMQFPFAIFVLVGFLKAIPKDYEEAAMIDGCGQFRILVKVIMPMAKPGIVTVCMISAMSSWNEFPVALVMLTDPKKQTLPVGLANLYEVQRYATDWGALFAALVLALIPTVIIFLVGQKQLIQGMNVGGLKG